MKKRKIFAIAAAFFASLCGVHAQTPGGTSGYTAEFWLKADNPKGDGTLYSNGQSIGGTTNNKWANLSGIAGRDFTRTTGTANLVQFVYNGFNFHPAFWWNSGTGSEAVHLDCASDFTTSSANSYYVFTVSNPVRRSSYPRTIFCLNPNQTTSYNRSNLSWGTSGSNSNALVRIGYSNSSTNTGVDYSNFTINNRDKPYGIISLSLPNNNSTTVRLNGRSQILSNANYKWNGTTAKPYIGNHGTTYGSFNGTMQEIIILSKPENIDMPAADVQKIQTYLAVKYGITIHTSSGNWLNTDGNPVWNVGTDYDRHIFGIGRDDASGLYQKQSAIDTVNVPITAVYVGNMSTLNSQNSGTLSNGQYVMLGTSGIGSLTSYAYANGYDGFYNGQAVTAPDGLNRRKGIVYRAQVTDPAQTGNVSITVKLAVADTLPYCLVSKNANFTPSETMIYPVLDGVATVELTSEFQYIDLAGFITGSGPGGVISGLKLWLRADDPSALTITTLPSTDAKLANYSFNGATSVPAVSEWSDPVRGKTYSWYEADKGSSNRRIPVYEPSNYMANYHPSVRFWGEGNSYGSALGNPSGIASTARPTHSSAYFLVNNDFNKHEWVYNLMFSEKAGSNSGAESYRGPGYGMQKDGTKNVGRFRTYDSQATGNEDIFTPGATSILGYHQSGTSVRFRFNGQEDNATFIDTYFNMTNPSTLGCGYHLDRTIIGVMTEAIIYEGALNASDEQRIESYLAIKYGITLRPSTSTYKRFNYTFSDGMSFWNGEVANTDKYAVFYNRIAAVIRDDAADLYNAQSHSTDVGSLVHMGVAGKKLGVSGVEVGELEYDTEAVVWGDDNASGTTAIPTNDVCGDIDYIFNRKWLVHKMTENDRPVAMLIGAQNNAANQLAGGGATGMFGQLNESNSVVLLVAASPEDIDNRIFKAIVPMSYIDGEHQCTYTFADEETYITFGYRPNNKGCEGEAVFEGRLEYDWSSQWPRQSYGDDNSMGTIMKPVQSLGPSGVTIETWVTYEDGIYGIDNYPQSVNSPFNGGLEIRRRRGNPGQKVTVTIIFNHPVIPNFSISDIDGYLGALESVAVTGSCSGQTYYPTLSYGGNVNASYYRIINGYTATATVSKDLSQTDVNGLLHVQFEGGVTMVTIEYTINNKINPNSTNTLVISPISIRNVPPPPPVNEDGLSFVKDVRDLDIITCEDAEVEYTFRIQNTNCDTMYVSFADTLSLYMKWKSLNLGVLNDSYNTHLSVNAFENTDLLLIDSIAVPGTSTLRFTATAILAKNTPTGYYSNRAVIQYVRTVNNDPIDVTLWSLDYETLNEETTFHATWQEQPAEVELETSTAPAKYGSGSVIEVSLIVNNPNATSFTDMFLEIDWDAGFSYVSNTGTSAGIEMVTPADPNDWARTFGGNAGGTSGFTLQPGTTVIKFSLQAPIIPEDAVDDDGNIITGEKAPLNVNYKFTTGMTSCVQLALSNLIGKLTVEYTGTHILLNRHVTTKILK